MTRGRLLPSLTPVHSGGGKAGNRAGIRRTARGTYPDGGPRALPGVTVNANRLVAGGQPSVVDSRFMPTAGRLYAMVAPARSLVCSDGAPPASAALGTEVTR